MPAGGMDDFLLCRVQSVGILSTSELQHINLNKPLWFVFYFILLSLKL